MILCCSANVDPMRRLLRLCTGLVSRPTPTLLPAPVISALPRSQPSSYRGVHVGPQHHPSAIARHSKSGRNFGWEAAAALNGSTQVEQWTVNQVQNFFTKYKEGKYASFANKFHGLDGAGMCRLLISALSLLHCSLYCVVCCAQ